MKEEMKSPSVSISIPNSSNEGRGLPPPPPQPSSQSLSSAASDALPEEIIATPPQQYDYPTNNTPIRSPPTSPLPPSSSLPEGETHVLTTNMNESERPTPTASGHSISSFAYSTKDTPPSNNYMPSDVKSNTSADSNAKASTPPPPPLPIVKSSTKSNTSNTPNTTGMSTILSPSPPIPTSSTRPIYPKTRSLPIHGPKHAASSTIASSTRSVKSMGSSIIDTDLSYIEDDEDEDFTEEDTIGAAGSSVRVSSRRSGGMGSGQRLIKGGKSGYSRRFATTEEDDQMSYSGLVVSTGGADNGSGDRRVKSTSKGEDNSQLLNAIMDMKVCMEQSLRDIREQNRRDFERVMGAIQQETVKRSTLHSQLLLQSETMVAMEVKLLRLEAKVEKREAAHRRRVMTSMHQLQQQQQQQQQQHSTNFASADRNAYLPFSISNHTIDEEDDLETMEIEVKTRKKAPSRDAGSGTTNISGAVGGAGVGHHHAVGHQNLPSGANVANIALISSGASLASAVTATSLLDGVEEAAPHPVSVAVEDAASAQSDDGDVEDEGDGDGTVHDGSTSTPTQGSSRHFTNLESILLNPIQHSTPNENALSTRAIRGDYDGNSSLATSVTGTTVTSTIVTATTRGGDSLNPRSTSQLTHDEIAEDEGESGIVGDVVAPTVSSQQDVVSMLGLSPPTVEGREERPPRSRSQSPLTVQSAATMSVGQSVASASVGTTSIMSTAAVAPARSFRARRDAAARMGNNTDGRSMANRVVSFTSNEVFSVSIPPDITEAGDSITMPDELDNLSDVADAFADRARSWREEYESRLDAIQKKWGGD